MGNITQNPRTQHPSVPPPPGCMEKGQIPGLCPNRSDAGIKQKRDHMESHEKIFVACPHCGYSNVPSRLNDDETEWIIPDESWRGKSVKSFHAFGG